MEEVRNFVTILSLGAARSALVRKTDRIAFLKERMAENGFRPATEDETRKLLRENFHPGFDVICIAESEKGPFVVFRKTRDTGSSFIETRISVSEITGQYQWFPVMPL